MKQKAIFLDRDGTINKLFDKKYICNIEDVELLPGVKNVLKKMKDKGYLLIVVTNQTGVGAGYYTKEQAEQVNKRIQELLGFKFDSIYSCYHHPDANCDCRKPKIGLFKQAMKKIGIDIENSFMIGDKCKDVQSGKKIGLKTIFIGKKNICGADFVCEDWEEIEKILTENVK